jgi:Spy/CpxP family protein refolding chaperone
MEVRQKESQPRRGTSMSRNSITKQIAVAAGFLALTFAPGITRAQSSQPPAQDQDQSQAAPAQHQGHEHGAMAGLNLTDDQKAQMKKIHESTKAQVGAVKEDTSLTADQKAAKIHQLRRGAREQVVKLLTPEQRQQMKANLQQMRAARQQQQQPPQAAQAQPQN